MANINAKLDKLEESTSHVEAAVEKAVTLEQRVSDLERRLERIERLLAGARADEDKKRPPGPPQGP